MPEDRAMIKCGNNPCPHGAYIMGRAELIQMVRMAGEEVKSRH